MRGFRYKHGDRPLEGYTIQRAAGRGGFGEVYYAVSDSGREVALKVVQGFEQIELRGVSQCMNLKSPHLVTIFDVRHNEEGTPFVIMEFVAGPSLRQLMDECPQGLGTQKAAFFLREIGKGLQHLHDCGIVHRDLKPGNIFYENGYVKIGDYGLSKAMAASQHSGQTITVGTVHYMAPEISMGKYDKAIDIYALGAMLYEMLTGQVPYLGSSPGEILMKHMTAEPNLAGIEEPFATVIRKAMHRDPAQRYSSVQEMVEAVFGSEHVQQSVSCFSPDSLSIVAERVAQRVAVGGGSATPPPLRQNRAAVAEAEDTIGAWADRFGERMGHIGQRMEALGEQFGRRMAKVGERVGSALPGSGAAVRAGLAGGADPMRDPLSAKQRSLLAWSLAILVAGATGFFRPGFLNNEPAFAIMIVALAAIGGGTLGIRFALRRLVPQLSQESQAVRRLAMGGLASAGLLLLSLLAMLPAPGRVHEGMARMIIPLLVSLFLTDWVRCTDPGRAERVSFWHAFRAAIIGFVASLIFGASPEMAIGILAGISLVVQIKSPWDPVAARQAVRAEGASRLAAREASGEEAGIAAQAAGQSPAGAPGVTLPPPLPAVRPMRAGRLSIPRRPVPAWARVMWLLHFPATLAVGIVLLVVAGVEDMRGEEFALMVAFGVGLIALSGLFLWKAVQKTFVGWWSYLIRPMVMWSCGMTILVAALILGNTHTTSEETAIGVFFIVFASAILLILPFIRGKRPSMVAPVPPLPSAPASGGSPLSETPPESSPVSANTPGALPIVPMSPRPDSMTSSITVTSVLAHSRNILLGLIGWVLLLCTICIGLTVSMDLPGMIAAGLPDPHLAEEIGREAARMQVESWPRLMRTILVITTGIGMFLSVIFLMMARRSAGVAHMVRSIIGVLSIVAALSLFYAGLSGHWVAIHDTAGQISPPASIDAFFNQAKGAPVVMAAIIMVGALTLLFWPASKKTQAVVGA